MLGSQQRKGQLAEPEASVVLESNKTPICSWLFSFFLPTALHIPQALHAKPVLPTVTRAVIGWGQPVVHDVESLLARLGSHLKLSPPPVPASPRAYPGKARPWPACLPSTAIPCTNISMQHTPCTRPVSNLNSIPPSLPPQDIVIVVHTHTWAHDRYMRLLSPASSLFVGHDMALLPT